MGKAKTPLDALSMRADQLREDAATALGKQLAQLDALRQIKTLAEADGREVMFVGWTGVPSTVTIHTFDSKLAARAFAGELGSSFETLAAAGVCTCDSIQYGPAGIGEVKLDLLGPAGIVQVSIRYHLEPPETVA